MSDLIDRDAVMLRVREFIGNPTYNETMLVNDLNALPSAEPERKWIPVTEALPEDKTWYLGIFKESDTGYCISVPFVCYYAGRKTMVTTKDYWILREYQDIYSFSEYYRNLECAAWMPLPEPYRGDE